MDHATLVLPGEVAQGEQDHDEVPKKTKKTRKREGSGKVFSKGEEPEVKRLRPLCLGRCVRNAGVRVSIQALVSFFLMIHRVQQLQVLLFFD